MVALVATLGGHVARQTFPLRRSCTSLALGFVALACACESAEVRECQGTPVEVAGRKYCVFRDASARCSAGLNRIEFSGAVVCTDGATSSSELPEEVCREVMVTPCGRSTTDPLDSGPDLADADDGSVADQDAGPSDASGPPLPATYATFSMIVGRSCTFGGSCHGGPSPRRASNFLNFEVAAASGDYREALVGVRGYLNDQVYLLVPGDPDRSYLWHKLADTHRGLPMCGLGSPAPTDMERLPANELDAIQQWIVMGAPGPDGSTATVPVPLPGYVVCPEPTDAGL